jgi:substrate-binding family protein
MSKWLRWTDAFIKSEQGLKTAGVMGVVLLVTSIASIGANKPQQTAGPVGAPEGPVAETVDSGAAPTPEQGLSDTTGSGARGPGTEVAPGSRSAEIPPALRGADFGLRTQGVTSKEVKVGISGNFDNCGDTAGLVQQFGPLVGDPVKSFNTFVRYVNDHGGVGGRRYKAILVQDGGSTCPERNLPAAVKMADEEKVFLAIPGLHVESDYIIDRKIPVWGGRDDPASLSKYGPNGFALFEPIAPTLQAWASFGKHYLKTDNGPNAACLIRIETGASGNWDIPEKMLKEDLARYGIRFKRIFVFKDDASTAQEQSNAIAIRARDAGCQQAWFMAGNPVGLIFITDAATQNHWFPKKWTWTSHTALVDDDRISKAMDQVQWENSVGLTYRIPEGEHPKSDNCKNIYEDYNGDDGLSESAYVIVACSAVLSTAEIMNRGIALTGRLDGNSFVIGANAITNDFYWDSHIPMDFKIPGQDGPFKTRAFDYFTVADWSSSQSKYTFPKYPCYYRQFGPNGAGCEDLRSKYRK